MSCAPPWEIKRFSELVIGDELFRARLAEDAGKAVKQWGLSVDPDRLRFIWDSDCQDDGEFLSKDPEVGPYFRWKESREANALHWLKLLEQETPDSFRTWRKRQANRYATQAADGFVRNGRLLPFAIELSKGCTVGCSYCALSAEPLQSVARFDLEGNEKLFTKILHVMREFVGQGAATGFLYWATDPFDNPDYEKYLTVFNRILGIPPQTTTAAWKRNVRRTRRFLQQRGRMGGTWDRFSVNSLSELHFLMTEFSPQELENVELVLQNPESLRSKCFAGRGGEMDPDAKVGSIACVSGFLINLLDRSVKLISPCTDLKRWPLGYAVYKEAAFPQSISQLSDFVSSCENSIFSDELNDNYRPRLRDDIEREGDSQEGTVALKTAFARRAFVTPVEIDLLGEIDGQRSVGELVESLSGVHHPASIYHALKQLYQEGLFEHLPAPEGSFQ